MVIDMRMSINSSSASALGEISDEICHKGLTKTDECMSEYITNKIIIRVVNIPYEGDHS